MLEPFLVSRVSRSCFVSNLPANPVILREFPLKNGLPAPSKIRMGIFTLDHNVIVKGRGGPSARDQKMVKTSMQELMHLEKEI